jgi:hypothetical protein
MATLEFQFRDYVLIEDDRGVFNGLLEVAPQISREISTELGLLTDGPPPEVRIEFRQGSIAVIGFILWVLPHAWDAMDAMARTAGTIDFIKKVVDFVLNRWFHKLRPNAHPQPFSVRVSLVGGHAAPPPAALLFRGYEKAALIFAIAAFLLAAERWVDLLFRMGLFRR